MKNLNLPRTGSKLSVPLPHPFVRWLRRVFAPVQREVCWRCGIETCRPDGCGCYYRSLREDAERKDMIARLSKWQRGE